jgi:hypothetical protein
MPKLESIQVQIYVLVRAMTIRRSKLTIWVMILLRTIFRLLIKKNSSLGHSTVNREEMKACSPAINPPNTSTYQVTTKAISNMSQVIDMRKMNAIFLTTTNATFLTELNATLVAASNCAETRACAHTNKLRGRNKKRESLTL